MSDLFVLNPWQFLQGEGLSEEPPPSNEMAAFTEYAAEGILVAEGLATVVAEPEPAVEHLEALTEEEESYRDRIEYGHDHPLPAEPVGSDPLTIEAESAYAAVAIAPTEVSAYMEYAFDTAHGSREDRLERLVVFAPTWYEAAQIVETFANERLLSGGLYNLLRKFQPRWCQAELGTLPGKAEWLAALGIESVRVFLSPDLGSVDVELLKQLPRLIEIGAEPAAASGDSFVSRLQKMLTEDAKKRQEEWNRARQARRDEQGQLNTLANRRRRRMRGERVEEAEDAHEQEALLAASIRHWTPEMTEWALYAARVKILGVQVSGIIRNPLLSVEQKQKRIVDAKSDSINWCIFPVDPESRLPSPVVGYPVASYEYGRLQEPPWPLSPVAVLGPASPWPLWENLHLVESELHPIYTHLANLRVEFRLAEMWAESRRGPAKFRGRVDMIDRDRASGPVPLVTTADRRLVEVFRDATTLSPAPTDHDALVAEARRTSQVASRVLGWWQGVSDPAEKEAALPEVRYLIKAARKAERKLANPLPGRATGNRRRRLEKRLPLLKAARLRRKAEAKASKKPVAENKPRRKKDRAA